MNLHSKNYFKAEAIFDGLLYLLVLTIIFFLPLYFDLKIHSCFDLGKVTLLQTLTLLFVIVWALSVIHRRKITFKNTPLDIPIAIYLAVCIAATIFSINWKISLIGNYNSYEGLISQLTDIVIFYAIVNLFDSHKRFNIAVNIMLVAGIVSAAYGVCQHYGIEVIKWEKFSQWHKTRVQSSLGNAVFFANYLVTLLPVTFALFIRHTSKKIFFDKFKIVFLSLIYTFALLITYAAFLIFISKRTIVIYNWHIYSNFFYCLALAFGLCVFAYLLAKKLHNFSSYFLGVVCLLYWGLLWTGTRGAYVGLFFGIVIFFLLSLVLRKIFFGYAFRRCVIAAAALFLITVHTAIKYPEAFGRFGEILTKKTTPAKEIAQERVEEEISPTHTEVPIQTLPFGETIQTRFFLWKDALKIIQDYPILGIGLDTLELIYPYYRSYEIVRIEGQFSIANSTHNEFLDIAVNAGIIGVLSFLLVIGTFVVVVLRALGKELKERTLLLGMFIAWCVYLMSLQSSFGIVPTNVLFWGLMALSCIIISTKKNLKQYSLNIFNKKVIRILCYVIVLGLGIFGMQLIARRYIADYYYKLAQHNQENKITYSEKALKLNPYVPKYYDNLIQAYINAGKYLEARALCKHGINFVPYNSGYWNFLGLCYFNSSDEKEQRYAALLYKKAIKLNNYFASAHQNLGVWYANIERDYYKAFLEFRQAAISNPKNIEILNYIGGVGQKFMEAKDYRKAEAVFVELEWLIHHIAQVSYPKELAVYQNLEEIYNKLGNIKKAMEYRKKIVQFSQQI